MAEDGEGGNEGQTAFAIARAAIERAKERLVALRATLTPIAAVDTALDSVVISRLTTAVDTAAIHAKRASEAAATVGAKSREAAASLGQGAGGAPPDQMALTTARTAAATAIEFGGRVAEDLKGFADRLAEFDEAVRTAVDRDVPLKAFADARAAVERLADHLTQAASATDAALPSALAEVEGLARKAEAALYSARDEATRTKPLSSLDVVRQPISEAARTAEENRPAAEELVRLATKARTAVDATAAATTEEQPAAITAAREELERLHAQAAALQEALSTLAEAAEQVKSATARAIEHPAHHMEVLHHAVSGVGEIRNVISQAHRDLTRSSDPLPKEDQERGGGRKTYWETFRESIWTTDTSAGLKVDLEKALDTAELLIKYAAEHWINLKDVNVLPILNLRRTLTSNAKPTVYEEEQFWKAYAGLVIAVKPANPDSVRARAVFDAWPRRDLLHRATRRFRRSMLVALIFALVVNWYYSTLDAPIANAQQAREVYEQERERISLLYTQLGNVAIDPSTLVNARRQMCAAFVNWHGSINIIKRWSGPTALVNESVNLVKTLLGAMVELFRSLLNAMAELLRTVLYIFYDFVRGIGIEIKGLIREIFWGETADSQIAAGARSSRPAASIVGEQEQTIEPPTNTPYFNACRTSDIQAMNLIEMELGELGDVAVLEEGKGWRDRIATYLLPLLYGLLGAFAHILRTLSEEIKNVTFALGTYTVYTVRWLLGALAGVTIGLAVQPETLSSLQGVTQLGIAFLAGYSVDVLFSYLDRLRLREPSTPGVGPGSQS